MGTRITVTLPQSLRKAVEEFAAKDGGSINQYIAIAVAEKIGAMGAAEFFKERGKGADPAWAIEFLKKRPE